MLNSPAHSTHRGLLESRWHGFSLAMQMGNIGSEVNRLMQWKGKDAIRASASLGRALELIDLTISDPRWKHRVGEFLRLREVVADAAQDAPSFSVSTDMFKNYFLHFSTRSLSS